MNIDEYIKLEKKGGWEEKNKKIINELEKKYKKEK